MRGIVFIKGDGAGIDEVGLECCSRYTPLVEPQADGSVYLDITGCGKAEKIVFGLAKEVAAAGGNRRMGWASSRLLARVALERSLLPPGGQDRLYRIHRIGAGIIIEVIPGCEEAFLSQLPLAEFPPLKPLELKKLSRAAFATVGDIARQPQQRLSFLLGPRTALVLKNSQGRDDAPVLGLYPPQRLVVSLEVESQLGEGSWLEQQLSCAARTLERLLGQRGAGARRVRLEVSGEQEISRERRLSQPCFQARVLENILLGLWKQMPPLKGIWQGRVLLEEVAVLNWQQQDLFALRTQERQRSKALLQEALYSLEMRFPGQISLGQEAERREQVLALWDPWRFQTGPLAGSCLQNETAAGCNEVH